MRLYDILREAKSAPLYHATGFYGAQQILQSGHLAGSEVSFSREEFYHISTTRNPRLRYYPFDGDDRIGHAPVQFVINQEMVSQRYKMSAFDYGVSDEDEERIHAMELPLTHVTAMQFFTVPRDFVPNGEDEHFLREVGGRNAAYAALASEAAKLGIAVVDLRRKTARTVMRNANTAYRVNEAAVPSAWTEHLHDAIEHADVYGTAGWTIDDFRVVYLGLMTPDQIGEFDDFSSWVETDDKADLESFRDGTFAVPKRTKFPPIIVITAPDADEGECHTQIGDGRGRVNWAVAHNAKLHVYHMIHRDCDSQRQMTETQSHRTFHVYWRCQGADGYYVIEASSQRRARQEAKRYLDARFLGGKWRITQVRDLAAEADHAKAVADYETGTGKISETIDALPDTKGNWAPYIVRRSVDDDGRTVFNVFQQAHKIASATLSSDMRFVSDVSVLPEHQRRGIAKALYRHIEGVLGYRLKPSPLHQTAAGKALWSSRDDDQITESDQKPLAIIVKGNPKYLRKPKVQPMADAFYADVKQRLVDQGFRVEFDPGKPFRSPNENATVWIGHSRGIDRLRFAPKTVKTIALQTKDHDNTYESHDERGIDPLHYQLSPADIAAIQAL